MLVSNVPFIENNATLIHWFLLFRKKIYW